MNVATDMSFNDAARARSHLRRRVARIVAAASACMLLAVCVWAYGNAWPPARAIALARGTGWVALLALLLSLLVTPLGRVAARFGIAHDPTLRIVTRRALGMCAAWLALGHALCSLAGTLGWNWAALWSWPHLQAGASALLMLLVLLVTSFAAVVAALRLRFWRELHRLAYLVPLLVLQHALLSPFAPRAFALTLVAAVYALGLTRYLPAATHRPAPDANPHEPV